MDGIKGQESTETLTEAAMKREFRRLSKLWHPDVWNIGLPERSDSVIQVISRLFQEMKDEHLANYDVWPSAFEDDYRVIFPAFSGEELQKIEAKQLERHSAYLPRTPREFLALLKYIEHNRSFPKKQFPRVALARSSRSDVFAESRSGEGGFMDQEFADEFARFKTALGRADSIEQLKGMVGAIDVLPPGVAEAHKLHDIIDGQAEYLLSGALLAAKNEIQFIRALEQVETFPFSQTDTLSRIKDLGMRSINEHFEQKIMRAASSAGLEKISNKIKLISDAIPESKLTCDELLLLIERKNASYASIWASRKASRRNIDK